MTDTRAAKLLVESIGTDTAPGGFAAGMVIESIEANPAPAGFGAGMVIEVIGRLGTPPPPPPPNPGAILDAENQVFLRWSDDRGHRFGNPVGQGLGNGGDYRISLQWQRLGMARDRVFEISWSAPNATALQGAWVDITPAQS